MGGGGGEVSVIIGRQLKGMLQDDIIDTTEDREEFSSTAP